MSEREESPPPVDEKESEQSYPEELFNLATLAEVSLAYAGQYQMPVMNEQLNQAR